MSWELVQALVLLVGTGKGLAEEGWGDAAICFNFPTKRLLTSKHPEEFFLKLSNCYAK